MDIAKRITELREGAGESRKEFSVHTGIPVRTLEDWEAGRRTPPEYIPRLIEYQMKYEKLMKEKKETPMNNINNTPIVQKQYENSSHLNTRISIHDKYSVNKMGFGTWIFSNYEIKNGMRILELGCGTGDMWKGKTDIIKKCSKLILTDFSKGMLETAQANVGQHDNLSYQVVDIQSIPFAENTFDIVIANMMLYHIPDMDKALSEVKRVLKHDGKFYCATYGEHGIIEYLSNLLSVYGVKDHTNKNFTLQNGRDLLERKFEHVQKLEYPDALEVTNIEDMMEYIESLSDMTTLSSVSKEDIKITLEQNMVNGILTVPKEYGMFIAW